MQPLLSGLRIVDLTAVVLGPYATQILGDFGADVIKVEPLEGDSMRPIAPIAEPGIGAVFANHNRNKRSIALDLKHPDGKAVLRRLVGTADAFVHNMRQEAIDRLGFGFDVVRELNPRAVYCAAVGFGRGGRWAGRPAYDDVIQAASGFAGLFQMRDGTPLYAPSIAADKISGLHLVYALLAALLYRERTGKTPGYVEVPMYEAMAAFSLVEHLGAATFDEDGRVGYVRVMSPQRRPYKTADGWIGVLPYSVANWTKVLTEIGQTAVLKEPWFIDATERSRRVDDLYVILAAALPSRSTAEWLKTFERLDIPHSIVRTPQDLLSESHLAEVGFFEPAFSGETPIKRTLRQAVRADAVKVEGDIPPPRLGADTRSVLAEIGFAEADIARLVESPGLGRKGP